MAPERFWRFGATTCNIYESLDQTLRRVQKSSDLYLDNEFLRRINVQQEALDLDDTDDFFECMTEEAFAQLRPSYPLEPFHTYEDVEHPDSDPPSNVFEFEDCARDIEAWLLYLQRSRVAQDGHGCIWPKDPGFWIPRQLRNYEDLRNLTKLWPAVPWAVARAKFNTSPKPHQIYHIWCGDEGLSSRDK